MSRKKKKTSKHSKQSSQKRKKHFNWEYVGYLILGLFIVFMILLVIPKKLNITLYQNGGLFMTTKAIDYTVPMISADSKITSQVSMAEEIKNSLLKRLDSFGIKNASMYVNESKQIVLEIQAYSDQQQIKDLILPKGDFEIQDMEGGLIVYGGNLKQAVLKTPSPESKEKKPTIDLVWDEKGKEKFSLGLVDNKGKSLKILLDGELLATVSTSNIFLKSNAYIPFDQFSQEEAIKKAKEITAILNGGSLPLIPEIDTILTIDTTKKRPFYFFNWLFQTK